MTDSSKPDTAHLPAVDSQPETAQGPTAADAPAASPAAAATASPARRSGGGVVISLLALLVGAYGVAAAWGPHLPPAIGQAAGPLLPGPADDAAARQEVEALGATLAGMKGSLEDSRKRLSALEQALATVQTAQAAPSPTPAAPPAAAIAPEETSALRTQVAGLEKALAAAEAKAAAALTAQAEALGQRLDGVEAKAAQASSLLSLSDRVNAVEAMARRAVSRQDRAVAFLLAVGELRLAVDAGQGFTDALKTVQAVAPAGVDVKARAAGFAAYADGGVPPLTRLRQAFAALAPAVVRAGLLPEDGSWSARTVDRLMSVVSIQRVDGDAVGEAPAAIVTRAEALLAAGDLAGAAAVIGGLKGPAAELAAPWLKDAEARLAATRGLGDLTGDALARLAESALPPAEDAAPSTGPSTGRTGG